MRIVTVCLALFLLAPKIQGQKDGLNQVLAPDNIHHLTHVVCRNDSFNRITIEAHHPQRQEFTLRQFNGGFMSTFLLFDSQQPMPIRTLGRGTSTTFSSDGRLVAIFSTDERTLTILSTEDYAIENTLLIDTQGEPIHRLAIDPTNSYIALAVGNSQVVPVMDAAFVLLDMATGERILSLRRTDEPPADLYTTDVEFSADGSLVYAATSEGIIHRWEIATGMHEVVSEAGKAWEILDLTRLIDGRLVYEAEQFEFHILNPDNTIQRLQPKLYDASEQRLFELAPHPLGTLAAAFVVFRDTDVNTVRRIIQFWDLETGELVHEFESPIEGEHFTSFAFSSDGERLLTTTTDDNFDDRLRVWGIGETVTPTLDCPIPDPLNPNN